MKKAAAWKLFVVMAVCTMYFTAFSRLGAFAYDALAPDDGRFRPGTAVGPVSLSGLTPSAARQAVAERVNEWRATAAIPLRYQEKQAELPADAFAFQLEESLKQLVDGQRTPLFVLADLETGLHAASSIVPPAVLPALDVKRLGADLEAVASRLEAPSSPVDLAQYISLPDERRPVVSEAAAAVSDAAAARWLSKERRAVIKANQLFSFGDYMKKAKADLSAEAADAIASAVYRAVLATNFTVVERYTSRMLPGGAAPGFEAAISDGRDLEWFNPNTTDYTLALRYDGRNVRASIIGLPFVYQYTIHVSETEKIEPRTVVQYDSRLAPGEQQTKQSGRPGLLVKVMREVRDGTKLVRRETVSEDFYPPTYTIQVRGLEVPESSAESNGGGSENSTPVEQPASSEPENDEGKEEGDKPGEGASAPKAGAGGETDTGGGEGK
ncbi:hypothetical protein M493_13630 [Geobacillus genomosp. 3]|uniref:G5 domain-containing protein n=1 Tax=Geobacillus genomosp. 3 TaxID=1921421 RepID=S5Z7Z5_GEOG3|nr:G5 domain-containing protein [Geobacillus genomosp. 3]AGT32967.1 hypothetical protein M493_13630 [Geobacillus genomosp. 3]